MPARSAPAATVQSPQRAIGPDTSFNYDALGANQATDLRAVATRIRGRLAASVIETGREAVGYLSGASLRARTLDGAAQLGLLSR
jgi:hypothetical protein